MNDVTLHLGDCLEYMRTMPAGSVDAIITDIPYGTTACEWDSIIPLEPMWDQVKHICKGAFVTTASQPFTSALIMSKLEWFKYEWIYDKKTISNPANAKIQPLKCHENIVVFSQSEYTYNPQKGNFTIGKFGKNFPSKSEIAGNLGIDYSIGVGYPKTILTFLRPNNLTGGGLHPTQKPVTLYEYLIRTYTNVGDTVLDFCMGSGTTGVAAVQLGRRFIGCEIKEEYFKIAEKRIKQAEMQPSLFIHERQPEPSQLELV